MHVPWQCWNCDRPSTFGRRAFSVAAARSNCFGYVSAPICSLPRCTTRRVPPTRPLNCSAILSTVLQNLATTIRSRISYWLVTLTSSKTMTSPSARASRRSFVSPPAATAYSIECFYLIPNCTVMSGFCRRSSRATTRPSWRCLAVQLRSLAKPGSSAFSGQKHRRRTQASCGTWRRLILTLVRHRKS